MARRVQFKTPDLNNKRNRIVLNVSGQRFMTEKSSLTRHPHTLLGSHMLARFFDEVKQEYFFDRDPHLFRYILNYYQSGKLHSSPDDCPVAFKDELDYFGIPLCELDDCCWYTAQADEKEKHPCHYAVRKKSAKEVRSVPANYLTWKRRDDECGTMKTRKETQKEGRRLTYPDISHNHLPLSKIGKRQETLSRKHEHFIELARAAHSTAENVNSTNDCENGGKCEINCKCRPWSTDSKFLHQAFNLLYGVFIILSVVTTTVETIDCETGIKCLDLYSDLFFAIDSTFVAVFTLEFLIRFGFSKNRCTFMKDFFNIIDLFAILPYYISLIASFVNTDGVTLLITLRVLRVSRIMKLTRGSSRLQSLLYTLKNCSTDLMFLYFTFTLGILLFASVLYYVERTENPESFKSIPHSLWYTCVTMMTTG